MKIAVFSLLISICVAIISIFQFENYQNFILNTQLKLNNLDSKISDESEHIQNEVLKFNKQTETISSLQAEISNANKVRPVELSEAKYLMLLAQTHLQTDRDIPLAISLLITVRDKLSKLDDNFGPLRESLNIDLNILQSLHLPSTEELWLKVSNLIEQSAKMQTLGVHSSTEIKPAVVAPQNAQPVSNWKQALLKSWTEIKDLVKIRHYAKPIEGVLLETEQKMIQENLRLLLEQIRFAILIKENKIYQRAIQETLLWIEKYYDEQDTLVKEIHNSLASLKEITLNPELPTLISFELFNKAGS